MGWWLNRRDKIAALLEIIEYRTNFILIFWAVCVKLSTLELLTA
jgi:hypothetical protein